MFLYKRQTRARQDRCYRAIQDPIDLRRLGEVGYLCRTAIVSNGGKEEILNDGTQSYIRAKAFRVFRGPAGEFFRAVFLFGLALFNLRPRLSSIFFSLWLALFVFFEVFFLLSSGGGGMKTVLEYERVVFSLFLKLKKYK